MGRGLRIKQVPGDWRSNVHPHPLVSHSTHQCWHFWATLLQHSAKRPIKYLAPTEKGRISPGLRGNVLRVVTEMSRWTWNQKWMSGLHYEERVSRDRPEQVKDSSRMLWIERCEELLSASCRISSYWHAGRACKALLNERTSDGPLYCEGRSCRISLPLTLWGRDVPACRGNLSSAGLQVVQRSRQGARPHQARKQDRFFSWDRPGIYPA